jgi:hypothetical protein
MRKKRIDKPNLPPTGPAAGPFLLILSVSLVLPRLFWVDYALLLSGCGQ